MSDTIGFIKIGSIKGDATDENHKEWIEVVGAGQSIYRNVDSTLAPQQALTTSKAVVNALQIQKKNDSSSAEFIKAICSATVFPEVKLELTRTTDGGQKSYYTIIMTDAYVANYDWSGGVSGMESFSLMFSTIKWDYSKTKPDGSPGGNVKAGWDVGKNKAI